MTEDLRIKVHPALGSTTGKRVAFTFDGERFEGTEGEPIAFALYASGIRTLGYGERVGEPRGVFCGIGHCYNCRVTVDGVANIRACVTPIRAGMQVLSQKRGQAEVKRCDQEAS